MSATGGQGGTGGGATGGAGEGGQSAPAEWIDAATALAEWVCGKGYTCAPLSGAYLLGGECVASFREKSIRLWRSDSVSADELLACVDALGRTYATCEAWVHWWWAGTAARDYPEACRFRGPRPDGALCETSEQCASGFCAGYVGVDNACGLCVQPAPEGQPCMDSVPCDYELACIQNKCTRAALEGAACSAAKPCAYGWCDQGLPLPVCAPRVGVDEPCNPDMVGGWGRIGLECTFDTACNTLSSTCQTINQDARVKKACGYDPVDGSSRLCSDGWCQVEPTGEGTCIARKELGESCSPASNIIGHDSDCPFFAQCANGTCRYLGDILVCY